MSCTFSALATGENFSEYGVFFLSVNFLRKLSVFTFGEEIYANLWGIRSQNLPVPLAQSSHSGASLYTYHVGPP